MWKIRYVPFAVYVHSKDVVYYHCTLKKNNTEVKESLNHVT